MAEHLDKASLESSGNDMQLVLDKLQTIDSSVFQQRLDEQAKRPDSAAGIAIVHLTDIPSVVARDGQEYKFHVARVEAGKHVNPHVHFKGDEPYRLITGEQGIMHIGKVNLDEKNVVWEPPTPKKIGEVIVVKGGEVHSFENIGKVAIDFTFACPDTHLNATDRVFTADFKNGFPKYQK